MRFHQRIFGTLLVLTTFPFLGGPAAYGQQAPIQTDPKAAEPQLAEIVVTARRREESEQTVPIAITAFTSEDLQDRHITSPQDLQGQVPSLSVSPYGQSRETQMFVIRGQSQQYTAPSAVVQYMGEVPLVPGTISSVQGAPGQFLDLADAQVLRGPQGTLFGATRRVARFSSSPPSPRASTRAQFSFRRGTTMTRRSRPSLTCRLTSS